MLKRTVRTQMDFVPLLRAGFPVASLEAVTREMQMPVDAAVEFLGLPRRTLARRKQEHQPLDRSESERVLRAASVFAHAIEVLGSIDKARRWVVKENHALGGVKPMSLLDTDVGAAAVDDVLTRIEFGVFG